MDDDKVYVSDGPIEVEYLPTELEMYQDWVAQHTSNKVPKTEQLCWALMGLQAELGEVSEIAEKYLRKEGWIDHGDPRWIDEIGDVLWYLSALCNVLELRLDDVLDHNVEKLNRRVYGSTTKED